MTIRSLLLGVLGAVSVCSVTYFNDWVLRQTHFVGNNMPLAIYGSLVLFVLFFVFATLIMLYEGGVVGRNTPVIWEWLCALSSIAWLFVHSILLGTWG